MERQLKVFVIPREKLPGGSPSPAMEVNIQAASLDGLRQAARRYVEAENLRVRSISNTPSGVVAYAEEPVFDGRSAL